MATGINPITVATAGPIMAEAKGLSWDTDKQEVISYLNRYRLLLYTQYDKFKLFDDVFHCIQVSHFNSGCAECYSGFTLPNNVLGVEAVYDYGHPLTVRSRWRESHTGLGVSSPRLEAIQMAESFATERDLTSISKLKVFCEHEEDAGKKVYIEVVDAAGRQKRLCFTLISQGFAVSPVKVKKVLSVVKPTTKGSVLLAQQDGYELSNYYPWETVPTYRRMKLASSCCAPTILLHGNRRFENVYFDHDIVEVGNQLIIEAAGKYFKYSGETTEANEINTANFHMKNLNDYLIGDIARTRGNAIQDNSPFKGDRKFIRKSLPGYAKF